MTHETGWSNASKARAAARAQGVDPDGPERFRALGSDEGDPFLGWTQRCDATLTDSSRRCDTPWDENGRCPNAAQHRYPGEDSLQKILDEL